MTDQVIVYLRMRNKVKVKLNQIVTLKDVAQVIVNNQYTNQLETLVIQRIEKEDKNRVVIDVMKVIKLINEKYPNLDIQAVGPAQTILEVLYPKKTFAPVYFVMIWFLLFVGAGLTVMNFHEDVSMQQVHQKIFELITGKANPKPLMLQIPYSIGLGIGMILFFNHFLSKRINEEPSPLEVEMFNYQQDLDNYIIMHENRESEKKLDGN